MRKKSSLEKQGFFARHFKGIALVAVALIPTIYTTFFLGSMWDPYGNISVLPVAVVNEDEPVSYSGTTLDVGTELVEKLQDSSQMDFHFVDAETAQSGILDGSYYMVITIPSDFSANAATLMDDTPKKMELTYTTNPGTNYIASKMSGSALAKMKTQISSTVTKSYTETIFDQLGTIGTGMSDAADGAQSLADGVVELEDGNTTITENLKTLSESTLTFVDGAATLEDGITSYTSGVSSVHDGVVTLSDGIDTLSDGASSLASGATALSDGAGTLSDGVTAYTAGVSAASSGAQTLVSNSDSLSQGASSVKNGAAQLEQGSQALTSGLATLSASLDSSLSPETQTQLATLQSGLTQVQQGIQALNSALAATELPDTEGLTQTLTTSLTAIGQSAQDAGVQLQTLQSAITAMAQTEAFQSLDAASQQELLGCFSAPLSSLATDITDIGNQTTGLAEVLQSTDLSSTGDSIAQLKTSVAALQTGADQAIPGAQQAITNLSGGLTSVKQAVDGQLIPGSQTITAGLQSLAEGSSTLESGVNVYTAGVSDLADGLTTLDQNNATLTSGASALSTGAKTLADCIPSLTSGVSQLQSGAKTLEDGTGTLVSNNASLTEGAAQLTDGAAQIQSGAGQLADGSATLGDGMLTLGEGADTLQVALADGAAEVNDINATELTYDMFSDPVETEESYQTSVATNGNAMAAYMMAVGLWVAGLAFCVLLSPHDQKLTGKNATVAFGKQIGILWAMAIVQAVLMVGCLVAFNDFSPEYMGKVLVIACLSSIAFLTLEYCVNYYLGVVGSFVLLVFMVLQLSGCAGTYPLELSDRFYQIINPFMPFTYTVHGFRSGIASNQSITTDCWVLIGIAVVSAVVLYFGFRVRMKQNQTETQKEKKENSVSGKTAIV